eukprot:scaffold434_cov186-Pinguiococcus_pyrenoidosus.AAC.147
MPNQNLGRRRSESAPSLHQIDRHDGALAHRPRRFHDALLDFHYEKAMDCEAGACACACPCRCAWTCRCKCTYTCTCTYRCKCRCSCACSSCEDARAFAAGFDEPAHVPVFLTVAVHGGEVRLPRDILGTR